MESKTNYFKLGLFVFFIIIAIVATVVVIGVGAFSKKPFCVETYFDNSVQGLNVGSDVLFLGVPIGKVDELSFVDDKYDTNKDYIYVKIAIDNTFISSKTDGKVLDHADIKKNINDKIRQGLRLNLVSQGITGLVAIEASYASKTNKVNDLAIDWEPANPYIPSLPSIMTQITDSIETLVETLKSESVKNLGENLIGMVSNVEYIIQHQLTPAMENIRTATRESTTVMSNINSVIVNEVSGNIGPILKNVQATTDGLPQFINNANEAVNKTDMLLSTQMGTVDEILKNVSYITSNFRELSENASSYSSGVLFSDPPPETKSRFDKILKEEKEKKHK
ncbi:MAG: MlaD family protein [Kiritimatiellae bacterium]|jgi:phospholipid/cholesterol/gamma-HCH transport system substrate-binding protein|nr:MlaD family protein [Kiritimatiellia bacterium]